MSPSSESLRSQIYVLTSLLGDAQQRQRHGYMTRPDILDTSESTAGKTVQYIATLLTRGTGNEQDRNVAVTAGPVGANHFKIILSTARSPSISRSTSSQTNSKESDDNVASAADEHPIPNSSHLDNEVPLVREATLPTDVSEEVRKMLSEQEQTPAFASVYPDFFQYLPKVFEVLKYAAQGPRDDLLRADLFFVTQCRAKISDRIRALFKGYDMKHLRKWKPSLVDKVLPQTLVIKDSALTDALEKRQVPLVPGTTNEFVFDLEHAAEWLDLLLTLLDVLLKLVDDPNPESFTNLNKLMRHLTRLSLLLNKIPGTIWALSSLSYNVATSQKLASQRTEVNNEDNDDINEDDDDDLDDILPSRIQWSHFHPDTVRFVRGLYATFTCITACHYLSRSTILKQPITISYRALDLPAQRLSPLLESDLVFDEWFKAITDKEAKRELIQTAHKHHDNLKSLTTCACHCESTLMSALVAREQDQTEQTFLDFARDVNHLLSITQGLQDIGVAKKSCASCWLLAAVIKEEMKIDVRLPGTHSFYYPWIAPPHLPENILLRLKDKLLKQLISMVNGRRRESWTSSPASAGSDDEGFEGYDSEVSI